MFVHVHRDTGRDVIASIQLGKLNDGSDYAVCLFKLLLSVFVATSDLL